MTNNLLPKKFCPFNKMEECIGKDCAMYLDITNVLETPKGDEVLSIKLSSTEMFNPPCALVVSAFSSFYIYSLERVHQIPHDHL